MISLLLFLGLMTTAILLIKKILQKRKNITFIGWMKIAFFILFLIFLIVSIYYKFYVPGVNMTLYKICIILLLLLFLTAIIIIFLCILKHRKKQETN